MRSTNKYEVCGTTVYVDLCNGEKMICDLDDWENLKDMKWCKNCQGYAQTTTRGGRKGSKSITFHSAIMKKNSGFVIDHINRNRLDSRKENLRYATKAENSINSQKVKSASGIRGVYIDKRKRKKFISAIKANGKVFRLGMFYTAEEAERARKEAEISMYGEFSPHFSKVELGRG